MKKIVYGHLFFLILLTSLQSSGENWWQRQRWTWRMQSHVADKDFAALREEQVSITDLLEKAQPGSLQHTQLQGKKDLLNDYINKATLQKAPSLLQSIAKRLVDLISPR